MTVGRGDHPDVESLDAFADGERRDLAVDRHVRECHDCAEAVAALRRVRADLARLAALTMPDDVAGRIRAALAADAEQVPVRPPPQHAAGLLGRAVAAGARSVRPAGGAPAPRSTQRGTGRRRPRRAGSPREWLVAAVCLVTAGCLVAVVAAGISMRGGTDGGAATASLSGEQTVRQAPEAAAGEAGGDGAAAPGPADSAPPGPQAAATPSPRDADSGTDDGQALADTSAGSPPPPGISPTTTVGASNEVLTDAEFTGHVEEVLAQPATVPATVTDTGDGFSFVATAGLAATDWAALTSTSAAACYSALANRTGGDVLAVDQVHYLGGKALFVILSIPDDPESVVVVAVGVSCSQDGDASAPLRRVTVGSP